MVNTPKKSTTLPARALLPLNCDLGEGLDDIDAAVMPLIDQASIACGGHAGNKRSMQRTLALAQRHAVQCGAHPSYPDPEHFGRRSMNLSLDALRQSLTQQVDDLLTVARAQNTPLHYIKPHGALYNDCRQPHILACVLQVAQYFKLPVMLSNRPLQSEQALDNSLPAHTIADACQRAAVPLICEAFADRGYTNQGHLVPRSQPHALLTSAQSLAQVSTLHRQQGLYSVEGQWLNIPCMSLCIHSDTPDALNTVNAIRQHFLLRT